MSLCGELNLYSVPPPNRGLLVSEVVGRGLAKMGRQGVRAGVLGVGCLVCRPTFGYFRFPSEADEKPTEQTTRPYTRIN